jgi:hypothetical protein
VIQATSIFTFASRVHRRTLMVTDGRSHERSSKLRARVSEGGRALVILGGVASQWETREELWDAIRRH